MHPGPDCHDPGLTWSACAQVVQVHAGNFGTEATAQMLEFSSNWAWESYEDEATVQAATARDPEEGDAGKESDLLVDEESSTGPPPKASTPTAPTAAPSKPAVAPPSKPSPFDVPGVISLDFSTIHVPGTLVIEPFGAPAGSKWSVPGTPALPNPKGNECPRDTCVWSSLLAGQSLALLRDQFSFPNASQI